MGIILKWGLFLINSSESAFYFVILMVLHAHYTLLFTFQMLIIHFKNINTQVRKKLFGDPSLKSY